MKPTKICTHEELATVITVGSSYPQKLILSKIQPTKYCVHENLYVYGISQNDWTIRVNYMYMYLFGMTIDE